LCGREYQFIQTVPLEQAFYGWCEINVRGGIPIAEQGIGKDVFAESEDQVLLLLDLTFKVSGNYLQVCFAITGNDCAKAQKKATYQNDGKPEVGFHKKSGYACKITRREINIVQKQKNIFFLRWVDF